MKTISKRITIILGLSILASCDPSYNSYNVNKKADSNTVVATPEANPEVTPDTGDKPENDEENETTCDLSGRMEAQLDAKLLILNADFLSDYNARRHLSTYLDPSKTTVIRESFLVSQIDIAPRSYDEGVLHLENEAIIDPRNNQELNEYYSIQYSGYINLANINFEGEYQIGILSDDGVILELNNEVIVNEQSAHAAKFNCAENTTNFKMGLPLKLKLDYFQGPKTRVANTLLWRKVNSASDIDKSLCNKTFNNLNSLTSAGWEIIPQDVLARDIGQCI